MKRDQLGEVLDSIKNNYNVKWYIAKKPREIDYCGYYSQSIAYISGICRMLIIDNIIGENQVDELYDATREYLNTKSSKRLDALFDEMRKGVKE